MEVMNGMQTETSGREENVRVSDVCSVAVIAAALRFLPSRMGCSF